MITIDHYNLVSFSAFRLLLIARLQRPYAQITLTTFGYDLREEELNLLLRPLYALVL